MGRRALSRPGEIHYDYVPYFSPGEASASQLQVLPQFTAHSENGPPIKQWDFCMKVGLNGSAVTYCARASSGGPRPLGCGRGQAARPLPLFAGAVTRGWGFRDSFFRATRPVDGKSKHRPRLFSGGMISLKTPSHFAWPAEDGGKSSPISTFVPGR
jgi:hypothetical protein